MAENKVIFGLKNAHYSIITENADGTYTYAPPVALPGMTSLELSTKGDTSDFYADDVLYYTTVSNQGYDCKLSVANMTDDFRTDVLGETLDGTDNVLTESSFVKPNLIAFMFEFDGDQKATRHCLYNCTVNRPGLTSESKTDKTEPKPQDLTLTASPRPYDGIVKRSTTTNTPDAVYNAWYTTVYEPAVV